jgi:hypothetical protein
MTRTITLDGKEYPARYLTDAQRGQWSDVVNAIAAKLHNPFVGFMEKAGALPPHLQAVALEKFMDSPEYKEVPKAVAYEAIEHPQAVAVLCQFVTGEDLVTPDNSDELWLQLCHYIEEEALIVDGGDGIAQANAMRAKAGKSPLPARTASKRISLAALAGLTGKAAPQSAPPSVADDAAGG